jgi:hypothetical protein
MSDDKDIYKSITDISESDENFIKKFSIDFYQIITDTDFNTLEDIIIEWINILDKNPESIFGLMQNHKQDKPWFSSIIGFFYQYGISCDANESMALELYLLSINNVEKENDILNNNNIIIGKHLLSLFYYKVIIINKRNLLNVSTIKRSTNPIKAVLQKLLNPFKNRIKSEYSSINCNENTINDLKRQENLLLKNYLEVCNKQIKKLRSKKILKCI